MEKIIRILNALIGAMEIAIDAIAKVLDRAIIAIQSISRKIISLFLAMFRLIFYILPFVLFILIGQAKNWSLLKYFGIVVLVFVAILFIRDFLVAFKEDNNLKREKDVKIEKANRVIFIMIVLNVLTVIYAIMYYFFNISIEQVIGAVLHSWIHKIVGLYPNKM